MLIGAFSSFWGAAVLGNPVTHRLSFRPVYVFFGQRDDTVPPAVATYTAIQLPWAQLRPFNGTHFHLDIFEVASTLFPQQ